MDSRHLAAIGIPVVQQKGIALSFPGTFNESRNASGGAAAAPRSAPAAAKPASPKAAAKPEPAAKPAKEAPQQTAPEKATQYKAEAGKKTLTEPVYFSDTYLFDLADCNLLEASCPAVEGLAEGRAKVQVVLDRTVFHAQGGGQPADHGTLSAPGLPDLSVSMVSLRKDDGGILHDAEAPKADAEAWAAAVGKAKVTCKVDEARRLVAAKVHSAGHLLDVAVQAANLNWLPGKGYHFPDGPYVEYILNEKSKKIDMKKAAEKDQVVKDIQENLNRLIKEDGPVTVTFKDGMRRVGMGNEECPCGGTHVNTMGQIGQVDIKKLQAKQGNMRISYSVAGA